MDWSRFVTEQGKQLQTVGHHFSGSRPLNNLERSSLDRRDVCVSCHQMLPKGNLAVSALHHIKVMSQIHFDRKGHKDLLHKMSIFAAWGQLIFAIVGFFITILCMFLLREKNRHRFFFFLEKKLLAWKKRLGDGG